jgi:cysteine desulfurase
MKIGNTLYFDHQASTPVDERVLAEMRPYLEEGCGNPHAGDHIFGWRAAQAIEKAAGQVGALIGADADEVIWTSGATEANNLALLGLARAQTSNRHRILLGAAEHKSILAVGRALASQLGLSVELLPVDANGHVEQEILEQKINDDVLAISVNISNSEIGTIENMESISTKARAFGAIFHCDGAQAPCALDLRDLSNLADLVSLSSHKMYGPQGIGALYIRRDLQAQVEPIVYGGGQQAGLRSGTVPIALCVGMGAAAALLQKEEAALERVRLLQRRDMFVDRLRQLPWGINVNGPELGGQRHPGNANVRFPGFEAGDILNALQPRLAASTGSACTTGIPEPSHVLRAIGLSEEEANASIRFSLGRYTTDVDVEEAVRAIDEVLSRVAHAA